MNKQLAALTALLIGVILFFAVNIAATEGLRSARIDLTQGRLYTLSQGSRNIARSLEEPVRLTLYYSQKQANDLPAFKSYGNRVREVLREYANASRGKIRFEEVDPEPFSAAEDKASQAGLVGAPTGRGGDRLYFGLVGTSSTDRQEVIPFFDPSKEEFLEYDLTRLIYLLSNPKKKPVGLMSWLPIEGGSINPMNPRQQPAPPWQISQQVKELFDVRDIPTDAREIPADISVLMVVHPKNISKETEYAIDQFVLRGGRLLAFVDPVCDADIPPGANQFQALGMPRSSDLPELFAAWGIELTPSKVAGDRRNAIKVSVGSQSKPEAMDYVLWMTLGRDELDASDPVTGQLSQVNIITAGILKPKEGAGTTIDSLMKTSTDAQEIDSQSALMFPDPKGLLTKFMPSGQSYMLAARISGNVKSAFPEGRPAPAQPPVPPPGAGGPSGVPNLPPPPTPDNNNEVPGGALEHQDAAAPAPDHATAPAPTPAPTPASTPSAAPAAQPSNHLAASTSPINVIVVADCDMLSDRYWVQEERLFGQISLGYRKLADNGDFVIAALDNLSGSSDLIAVRARGRFSRPFEKVEDLRKSAEQNFLAKSRDLEQKLQETESKISELQRQRPDGSSSLILTPEQQNELDNFFKQRADIRTELRDVQHQLNKDIERLGTELKLVNIALMPALVGVGAVGLGLYRARRRAADRRSGSDH